MRTAETVLNIRRETALPFHVEITGERRDTETVMRRSEGGDWKSASNGNSLVAYPTASPDLTERDWGQYPTSTPPRGLGKEPHGQL
jgi:hypothetical protein